jgi:integrase
MRRSLERGAGNRGSQPNLPRGETKTGRPYVADLPRELTPYIDDWLNVHRPNLQLMATGKVEAGGHVWLDCFGKPMSGRTIQRIFAWWTERAFGKAIRPHLFRDIAVTELVDCLPEEIGIAPDLLGHADLRTTRKHYIQAHGMTAHVRVQAMIAPRQPGVHRMGDPVPLSVRAAGSAAWDVRFPLTTGHQRRFHPRRLV